MTVFRFADDPAEISLDYLKRLDAEAPGRWYGAPKWDGYQRLATKEQGRWVWRAKPQGSGSLKPMPRELSTAFEALDLPAEMVYCCEWVGTRLIEHGSEHLLYVWDWYPLNEPCPPFSERHIGLGALMAGTGTSDKVRFVDYHSNPGLVELFFRQVSYPWSEGIVLRRADSKNEGHTSRAAQNPHVLKCKYRDVRELKGQER